MQKIVIGIDEAGRGPLAGPVVACAIMVPQLSGLRDSKQLTPNQREHLYTLLKKHPAVEWGIGKVSEKQIDKINIYQATRLAMKKAVLQLERKVKIHSLIIDGNMLLDLPISQKAVVKADATIVQCMAASIIAKVTRDRLMLKLHKQYPQYGFDRHKGYGTPLHMEMLRRHGPCKIHRMSFAPCKLVY
jgi:ribonuclease HII